MDDEQEFRDAVRDRIAELIDEQDDLDLSTALDLWEEAEDEIEQALGETLPLEISDMIAGELLRLLRG